MSAPIEVVRKPLAEVRVDRPHLARHLESRGFAAIVTLSSGIAATMAYETADGRLVRASGSRLLFHRYQTAQAPK